MDIDKRIKELHFPLPKVIIGWLKQLFGFILSLDFITRKGFKNQTSAIHKTLSDFIDTTLKQTIVFLFFISCQFVSGQQSIDPTNFDYSKADSIALNFPKKKYKYYTELVAPLTESLQTEHEKFRVLFRWITDNISYNYGHKSSDADKVVKSKKAVCIGYSTLLKEMCNSAGIECEIIVGYSKTNIMTSTKTLKILTMLGML